jgi:RNA polymerase sigma-70 factor (ECF subfamily)
VEWVAACILPHEAELRRWLRRHVHTVGSGDTDDLIQETYSRLRLVDFERVANGRRYLFTVARTLLVEQARRARIAPMERMDEIEALRIPSEEPSPEHNVGARQDLERFEQIVASLPEQCRCAFTLQKLRGLSQREIAAVMNITEKTVEKHLATALAHVLHAMNASATTIEARSSA